MGADLFLNLANVLLFLLILTGASLHRRRTLHVRLMLVCFVLDLLLVLAVELFSSAVDQAMEAVAGEGTKARALLFVHLGFSALVLILWVVQLVLGWRLLRGHQELRSRHRRNAGLFLLVRLGNVVTAFLI